MDIPNSLDGWNLDVIEAIAATGDEGERYDFKLQLPDSDRVTAIACAFANTYGGFIVIGVGQQNGKFKIKGIEPDPEIYKHFHDKIQCEPEIRTDPPQKLFLENGNIVYVFHIRESQIKPHLPSKTDKRIFWKRMPSKNEQMSLTEVRLMMNDYEKKREKLTLLLIDLHFKIIDLAGANDPTLVRMKFEQYEFQVLDAVVAECFSLIKGDTNFIEHLYKIRQIFIGINSSRTRFAFVLRHVSSTHPTDDLRTSNNNAIVALLPHYFGVSKYLEDNFGVVNPYHPSPSTYRMQHQQ